MYNQSKRAIVEKPARVSGIPNAPAGGFIQGELYLYHPSDPRCPASGSLWGVYDRTTSGAVRLETSSRDLCGFRFWHPLPAACRYARLATRSELRDYTAALAFYECRTREQIPPRRYR